MCAKSGSNVSHRFLLCRRTLKNNEGVLVVRNNERNVIIKTYFSRDFSELEFSSSVRKVKNYTRAQKASSMCSEKDNVLICSR